MPQRLNSTEDEIFSNHILPHTQGDDDATPQDFGEQSNAPSQDEGQDDDNPLATPANADEAGEVPGDSGSGQPQPNRERDPTTGKFLAGQKPEKKEQQPAQTRGPQDLVDPKTGEVIAKGGKERRFYERAQKFEAELRSLAPRFQQATARIQQLEAENNTLKQANIGAQFELTPEETIAAGRLMAAWKSDPARTVQYLLTQAKARGHNIEGIGSTVDAAAIKQMVNEAIAPFRQDRESTLRQREQQTQAEQQYADFVARYPDAPTHDESIARLLERDPRLSPDAAYFMLKSFYSEHGLDWSKPLKQIEQELRDQRSNQNAQQPNVRTAKPLPNGRTPQATVQQSRPTTSASDDWESIIRESLREGGIGA